MNATASAPVISRLIADLRVIERNHAAALHLEKLARADAGRWIDDETDADNLARTMAVEIANRAVGQVIEDHEAATRALWRALPTTTSELAKITAIINTTHQILTEAMRHAEAVEAGSL